MTDLTVGRYTVPGDELHETFTTSGGPGGQHANRSETAVELRYVIADSAAFTPQLLDRLVSRLGESVTVTASESRSQFRNRALARQRLAAVLSDALTPPPPRRRPTRPSRGSVNRRLDAKTRRSETKSLRQRPRPDDG